MSKNFRITIKYVKHFMFGFFFSVCGMMKNYATLTQFKTLYSKQALSNRISSG